MEEAYQTTVPWYADVVQLAAYTESPPYAGFATNIPTSVISPAGNVSRILFAVAFKNVVNCSSFVVLSKKCRKQLSVFMTWTFERLLFPSSERP